MKKILIYGSTYLTQLVVDELKNHYFLVGYIPSVRPFVKGNINLPLVDENIDHDIKLSIQYDRLIEIDIKGYNIHTGLLPNWGGVDILYHTKRKNVVKQGLTFHEMTNKFDAGPIVSKITYPVAKKASVEQMYDFICVIIPLFALSSLRLIESGLWTVDVPYTPTLYKKGQVHVKDMVEYRKIGQRLKDKYENR
jgi:hypothetical protein